MDREQLHSILDAVTDGVIIIRRDKSIEFMNTAMKRLFGSDDGRKCFQVIYQYSSVCRNCNADLIIRDSKSFSRECYLKSLDKNFDIREFPLKNPDGSVSLVARYQDISQAKQDKKTIRAYKKDYRSLFEHVACGVFVSSKEGKFLDVNKTMMEMLGYDDKEEFLNMDIAKDIYCNPEDRRQFQEMIERNGKVVDYGVDFKHKSGAVVPIKLTGHVRYGENGEVIGYEGLNVDLTHQKRIESELEKTRLQLLQSEKMASLGKLSAGVAHQLNNPMSGITLYTQLIMEDYDLPEEAREDFKRVIANVQRCSEIVKQLLQFSRQTGRQIETFDINQAIVGTLALLEKQVLFQNVKIDNRLVANLPKISVDIQQMNHVFMNILINAADAMEGKGTLTLESWHREEKSEVCMRISDTGPGIKPEILNSVFDPFFTTKEVGKGTGLGLSIVYGIVEDHGGRITVENRESGGASFTIRLPITFQAESTYANSEFI